MNAYQAREFSELIDVWYYDNMHMIRRIETIPEELMNGENSENNFHEITMNRIGPEASSSIAYFIWDNIYHLEHHLRQLIDHYQRKLLKFDQFIEDDDFDSTNNQK